MLNINEELKIKTDKKLKDAIHDIVTTLKSDEFFDFGTISNILRHQYNIFITPNLLERFFILWNDNKDSIFNKSDKKWLKWDSKEKIIQNNIKIGNKKPVLAKSRKKLIKKDEEEVYLSVKKDGWIKLKDGRFVYNGNITFKLEDNEKNEISISKYEKDSYSKGENPITPELVKKVFVLDHPDDAEKISLEVDNAIKMGEIISKPENGNFYYYNCFKYMMDIAFKMKLNYINGWEKKYAPSKLKEQNIRRNKRIKYEKEQNELALKTLIVNREDAIEKLSNIIDINKKYFLIVTKYNDKKQVFMIKKVIYGYFDISNDLYSDGYYKVIIKKEKDSEDIIYFNTIKHFEMCLNNGLKGDDNHVFNIISPDNIKKIKIFFNELKKFKGWDEYLDDDISNKLKNDF
jgi:hypothetical protein